MTGRTDPANPPSAEAVIVEADGGSRGNPGPAGYGAVVRDADTGEVLAERKGFLGVTTNNVAEYQGLIAGLSAAAELGARVVRVRMDSKLVVEQMSDRWQIKHPGLRPLARRAGELARGFDSVTYGWIPRLQNSAADRLANQAMDAGAEPPATEPVPPATEPVPPATEPVPPAPRAAPVPEPALQLEFGEPEPPRPAPRPANDIAVWMTSDAPRTRCILLRHGVTEYSIEHRLAGRSDLDLTAQGIEQARLAAARIAELGGADAIYSSPLLRTRHTARLVADRLGLPVTVEDDLIETDYGGWDGHTQAEARQKWPAEFDAWIGDPAVAPPGGESLVTVVRRVRRARDRILREQPGRSVVVVSHVSPIKALMQLALDAPAAASRLRLSAASLSIIEYYADGAISVRCFNETAHLGALAVD